MVLEVDDNSSLTIESARGETRDEKEKKSSRRESSTSPGEGSRTKDEEKDEQENKRSVAGSAKEPVAEVNKEKKEKKQKKKEKKHKKEKKAKTEHHGEAARTEAEDDPAEREAVSRMFGSV
jgi:hypothetical protein